MSEICPGSENLRGQDTGEKGSMERWAWHLTLVLVNLGCCNKKWMSGFLSHPDIKQQTLIPHSYGGWKLKIKVLTWKSKIKVSPELVLGEGLLSGWQMAAFLLCSHKTDRGTSGISSSSSKSTNLITEAPPSWPLLNLIPERFTFLYPYIGD